MEKKLFASPPPQVEGKARAALSFSVLQCVSDKGLRAGAGPTFRPRLPQAGPLPTTLQGQSQLAHALPHGCRGHTALPRAVQPLGGWAREVAGPTPPHIRLPRLSRMQTTQKFPTVMNAMCP